MKTFQESPKGSVEFKQTGPILLTELLNEFKLPDTIKMPKSFKIIIKLPLLPKITITNVQIFSYKNFKSINLMGNQKNPEVLDIKVHMRRVRRILVLFYSDNCGVWRCYFSRG